MGEMVINWLADNYIEFIAALLGIAYILFSIRLNIFTWPTSLATSVLYIVVFFHSKFYADMALQFYYVFMSVYGWYMWSKGNPDNKSESIPLSHVTKNFAVYALMASLLIFLVIWFILNNFTDSPLPVADAFTTALSIVATYMLARKIIEHWLIWIVADTVSSGLYIYKNLWPTALLFVIYTTMAVTGYIKWTEAFKNKRQ